MSPTSPNQTTDASPHPAEETLKTPDPPVVKPRKFFKSRNALPADFAPDTQLPFSHIHPRFQPAHTRTESPSNHTNHFAHHGVQGLFKHSAQEPGQEVVPEEHPVEIVRKKSPKKKIPLEKKPPKPPKEKVEKPKKEKKVKVNANGALPETSPKKTETNSPNKRFLGRTRNKVVNYDEDADEDEFARKLDKIQLKTAQLGQLSENSPNPQITQTTPSYNAMESPSTRDLVSSTPMLVPAPQISPAPQAKIVLRISKVRHQKK